MKTSLSLMPLFLALAGCLADSATDTSAADRTASDSAESALGSARVGGARVVSSSSGARRLELVGANGAAVATYYPGFFSANLIVPDVEGNTGGLITHRVRGTDVLSAAINPRTGVVAVAVRGFIYAETSTDMVFLFNTRGSAFAANPYASPTFLPFDGRRADGTIATHNEVSRPFLDINGLSYDSAGRLLVRIADASGGTATIAYAPDLRAVGCAWVGGEGRRCPAH